MRIGLPLSPLFWQYQGHLSLIVPDPWLKVTKGAAPQAFQTPEVERHPGYLMASQAASDLKLWVLETDGMSVNSLGFSAGNMWAACCSSRTTY